MIILASASPRRKDILSDLGLSFEVITADTDESCSQKDPQSFVRILAERKGMAVYNMLKESPRENIDLDTAVIISADTVVYCDGEILGKPADREDALRMLNMIRNKEHSVISGVALTVGGVCKSASCVTKVRVGDIPDEKIAEYIDSGECSDKAGAYAIQGRFSIWVEGIDGCYFNVVGLPVNCFNKLYFECLGEYPV